MRIGHGFDAHRFGEEGRLVLGGVEIDDPRGMEAHSDGDVVLHALCDALLGAAALGDIGRHFPDSDPAFKGADSRVLLRQVVAKIAAKKYIVENADLTIIAQSPRLSSYIERMRERISEDLAVSLDQVNVKATTTEKMGYVGRQEGISVHAVVLIDNA